MILDAAREEGYSVIFHESALSREQEVKNIMALINLHVDGILWEPVSQESLDTAEYIQRAGIPFLPVNADTPDSINLDYQKMGYLATEALIQRNRLPAQQR